MRQVAIAIAIAALLAAAIAVVMQKKSSGVDAEPVDVAAEISGREDASTSDQAVPLNAPNGQPHQPETEPSPSGVTVQTPRALSSAKADASWEETISNWKVDQNAARRSIEISQACQFLGGSRANSDRFKDPRWIAVARRCPTTLPDIAEIVLSVPGPRSSALDALSQAMNSGDLARKDAVASTMLRSSNDPNELEAAAMAYFDDDRLRALSGEDRPASLGVGGDLLPVQIDLTLMVGCSFGRDCAPDSPGILLQCATTTLCYPGQSLQQIVAMRRSPEEMAYLERVLAYVHQMRKRGG